MAIVTVARRIMHHMLASGCAAEIATTTLLSHWGNRDTKIGHPERRAPPTCARRFATRVHCILAVSEATSSWCLLAEIRGNTTSQIGNDLLCCVWFHRRAQVHRPCNRGKGMRCAHTGAIRQPRSPPITLRRTKCLSRASFLFGRFVCIRHRRSGDADADAPHRAARPPLCRLCCRADMRNVPRCATAYRSSLRLPRLFCVRRFLIQTDSSGTSSEVPSSSAFLSQIPGDFFASVSFVSAVSALCFCVSVLLLLVAHTLRQGIHRTAARSSHIQFTSLPGSTRRYSPQTSPRSRGPTPSFLSLAAAHPSGYAQLV